MLNQIEYAMLRGRGYSAPTTEKLGPSDVVARASKVVGNRTVRAEALGRTEQDAVRKLLGVITRR